MEDSPLTSTQAYVWMKSLTFVMRPWRLYENQ